MNHCIVFKVLSDTTEYKTETDVADLKMTVGETSNPVIWTPEMEVNLFYAMVDHKPVGENKHFHMIFIYEKFNNLSDKKLTIEQIWQHLNTLYDMQQLDENEVVPFPNGEIEFFLPTNQTNLEMDTSNSNSDDLESSIKSTSTSGKNEPIKSTGKPQANINRTGSSVKSKKK